MLPPVLRRHHVERVDRARHDIGQAALHRQPHRDDQHPVDNEQLCPRQGEAAPYPRQHRVRQHEEEQHEDRAVQQGAGANVPGATDEGQIGVDEGEQRDRDAAHQDRAR